MSSELAELDDKTLGNKYQKARRGTRLFVVIAILGFFFPFVTLFFGIGAYYYYRRAKVYKSEMKRRVKNEDNP